MLKYREIMRSFSCRRKMCWELSFRYKSRREWAPCCTGSFCTRLLMCHFSLLACQAQDGLISTGRKNQVFVGQIIRKKCGDLNTSVLRVVAR